MLASAGDRSEFCVTLIFRARSVMKIKALRLCVRTTFLNILNCNLTYDLRLTTSDFQLTTSDFQLTTSDLQLATYT